MGPEEKAKVWKEFMSSPLAQEVYTTYYHDKYHGDEEEEDLKNLSIESIVHTSEMMNLLVHGYEARTLAEKPKEESQMGPKWLDEPNHPKDGSGKWYWVKLHPPGAYLVYWSVVQEWALKVQGNGLTLLHGMKVAPIQEPS